MTRMYSARVIIQPRGGGDPVETFLSPVPPNVELDTMRAFYAERFGDSLDSAFTEVPSVGRVTIGWVFKVPDGFTLPGPAEKFEMLIVPMVEDPDRRGGLVSVWVELAKERAQFEHLFNEGKLDTLTMVEERQRAPGDSPKTEIVRRERADS